MAAVIEPELTAPDGVVFDPVAHRYLLDGSPCVSVSTILEVVDPDRYAAIREDVLQRAAARGSATHAMIALDVRDLLDYSSLDGHLADDWTAWRSFCDDFGFIPTLSERVVCSRRHGFCGTLDLAGTLTHKRRREPWLVDIKRTAARPDLVGPQTAGYLEGAVESIPGTDLKTSTKRGCLWIRPGGRYELITCNDTTDLAVFLSANNILKWRERR